MRERKYSFSLGRIAVLEKKLTEHQVFIQLLDSSLKDTFLRLRDYFFSRGDFKEEADFLKEIFQKEKSMLKEICLFLLQDDDLKYFLENIEKSALLCRLSKDTSWDFLKDFAAFYQDLLNIVIFLRAKTYNLERDFYESSERDFLIKSLEKKDFLMLKEDLKKFYLLAEDLIKREENFLIDFLLGKFLQKFLEERRKELLGPQIIFWFYFAKSLNLEISKFLILGKFYGLNREILKRPLDLVYG